MAKRPMLVDEKCDELARHFLGEVKGATEEDIIVLRELIQTACEDVCHMIEERAAN